MGATRKRSLGGVLRAEKREGGGALDLEGHVCFRELYPAGDESPWHSGLIVPADGGGGRFEGNKAGAETRLGAVAIVWADDDESLRGSGERIEKRTQILEIFGSLNWQRDGVA